MSAASNFSPQSFAVVGAGPVGCIVACFLAKGGYEVTLCDVLPDLLSPALDPGIILEFDGVPFEDSFPIAQFTKKIIGIGKSGIVYRN